ncbi:MAG: tetratricopeptide repeat protein [Gemmatimonadota bacterium]
MIPAGEDPTRELRVLLQQGQYREILDRFMPLPDGAVDESPATGLFIATAATRVGSLGVGETIATRTLDAFRNRADDDGCMRCHNLLGAISHERGSMDAAASHFGRALELSRARSDLQTGARASGNLASLAFLGGRLEEAASLLREADLAYQRLGDRRGLAETYHNLSIIYRNQGDVSGSVRASEQAVRHADEVDEAGLTSLTTAGLAEALVADGSYSNVPELLDRAARLAMAADDPAGVAEADRIRATLSLALGDYATALALADQAVAEALRLDSAQLQAESAIVAVRALRGLHRHNEAAALRGEAEAIFERLGATYQLGLLRDR